MNKIKKYLYVLPFALILGVTPLIVQYKRIKLGEVVSSYWIKDINTDFFSYYKMTFFLFCILFAFIIFYIYIKKERQLKKSFYYIPLALYTLMIIISTVFSKAKLTSLMGFPDRYEGLPVLLGYVLVIIFAINLINSEIQLEFLFKILLVSAVIIGIIGVFQFYGYDFFFFFLGTKIITYFSGAKNLGDKLNFRFDDRNIIY